MLDGAFGLRLNILPPLGPETAGIELVVAGRSARVRARLPLHWCIMPL